MADKLIIDNDKLAQVISAFFYDLYVVWEVLFLL